MIEIPLLMPPARPQKMFGYQMINCETLLKSETGHDRSFYWNGVFMRHTTTEVVVFQMVNGLHSTLKIIFCFPPWPKLSLGWRNLPGPVPEAVRDLPSSRLWQRCVTTIFDSSSRMSRGTNWRVVEAPATKSRWRVLNVCFKGCFGSWFFFIGSLDIVRMYGGRVVL